MKEKFITVSKYSLGSKSFLEYFNIIVHIRKYGIIRQTVTIAQDTTK